MDKVKLGKGGKLYRYRYNNKTEKWKWKERRKLPTDFEMRSVPCEIEPGTTFKDIMLYLNRNLDYWDLMLDNYCAVFVKEALKPLPKDFKGPYYGDSIVMDYLELYWTAEYYRKSEWDKETSIHLPTWMDFHGRGHYEEDGNYHKKDMETNLGIGFGNMSEIGPYEIRVNERLVITDEWIRYTLGKKWSRKVSKRYRKIYFWLREHASFVAWFIDKSRLDGLFNPVKVRSKHKLVVDKHYPSLFQILYGIIWEVSWYGPPAKQRKLAKSLKKTIEGIKDGTIETKEWEPFDD